MPTATSHRSKLKPGEVLCTYCTALCCRYFTIHIHSPKTWADYDRVTQYLAQGGTSIFVEDDGWFLIIHGDCQYLRPDNLCGIYLDRPGICAAYTTEGCEFDNDFVFEKYFESAEQLQEYAEAILPPREEPAPEISRGKTQVIHIAAPDTRDDYDNMRWYLAHGGCALFVEQGNWYLVVYGKGEANPQDLHGVFLSRPEPEVTPDYDSETFVFEKFFETPEQVWEYAEAVLPPADPAAEPALAGALPILSGVDPVVEVELE